MKLGNINHEEVPGNSTDQSYELSKREGGVNKSFECKAEFESGETCKVSDRTGDETPGQCHLYTFQNEIGDSSGRTYN